VVGGITNIIITWETNETNIYLLVRAKCVRCNLVVQAIQSSLNTFLSRRGKKMWGVKISVACRTHWSERSECTGILD
jgi:hypothetical protein